MIPREPKPQRDWESIIVATGLVVVVLGIVITRGICSG